MPQKRSYNAEDNAEKRQAGFPIRGDAPIRHRYKAQTKRIGHRGKLSFSRFKRI